ncbi:MAG: carboxypeptidase-like regulatory domain-containing protein [Planctomycetota bacterium]
MPRALLLTLVLVAVVAGLAVYLGAGDPTPAPGDGAGSGRGGAVVPLSPGPGGPPTAAVSTGGDGDGRTEADLVAPDRVASGDNATGEAATDVVFPLRVELSLSSRASVPRQDDVMQFRAGAVAGIEGVVTGRDGRPVGGATVEFVAGPNKGRVLITDARGRYGASDLWQGLSHVLVRANGLASERPVRLARLARTPLAVDFSATVYVGVTVRDAAGRPIEGAEVRVDSTVSYSDPDGRAMFANVTVGKVVTSVRKDGFARIERELGLSRGTFVEPDDNVYTLRRGASLAVHVTHAGTTTVPAQLFIMPAGGSGGPGGMTLKDFPWHSVSPIEIPPGQTITIKDLPEDVVQLRVFHPGARAVPVSKHQRLTVDQLAQVELTLESAPALSGTVTRGGQVVANARVTLEAPDRDSVTTSTLDKKPLYAQEIVLAHVPTAFQETVTDARGRFRLTAYEGIDSGRYLTAESPDGRWRAAALVRKAGDELKLDLVEVPAKGGALELELPGRFQGLPVEVRVDGRPLDPFVLRPGEPLVVDDLEYGTWRVHAVWEEQDVLRRQSCDIGAAMTKLAGTLPEGALRGQPADVRRRVLGG